MKTYDVEQNSPEWYAARRGIPTASEFDKIITATGARSKQDSDYMDKLIAEYITGETCAVFKGTAETQRGKELEPEAIQAYELTTGATVTRVGFCTDDGRTMGCSPDALISTEGGLEMKCPSPHNHVFYMRTQKIAHEYTVQIQGNLLVTGRKWWDAMSYHPKMKPVIQRVERDNGFLLKMSQFINEFNVELKARIDALRASGYIDSDVPADDPGKYLRAG
jgi:hypothetical protein